MMATMMVLMMYDDCSGGCNYRDYIDGEEDDNYDSGVVYDDNDGDGGGGGFVVDGVGRDSNCNDNNLICGGGYQICDVYVDERYV